MEVLQKIEYTVSYLVENLPLERNAVRTAWMRATGKTNGFQDELSREDFVKTVEYLAVPHANRNPDTVAAAYEIVSVLKDAKPIIDFVNRVQPKHDPYNLENTGIAAILKQEQQEGEYNKTESLYTEYNQSVQAAQERTTIENFVAEKEGWFKGQVFDFQEEKHTEPTPVQPSTTKYNPVVQPIQPIQEDSELNLLKPLKTEDVQPSTTPLYNQNEAEKSPNKVLDSLLYGVPLLLVIVIQAVYFAVVEHHYSKNTANMEGLGQNFSWIMAFAIGFAFELTALTLAVKSKPGQKEGNFLERIDGSFWWLLVFATYGYFVNIYYYDMDYVIDAKEWVLAAAKPVSIMAFGHLFARAIRG